MKIQNIYFSPTGGVKKVADVICGALKDLFSAEAVKTIDLSAPKAATDGIIQNAGIASDDFCVISAPSFSGRLPALCAERLSQLSANGSKAAAVCVYGNRAFDDALLELSNIAEDCGFNLTGAISAVAQHSLDADIGANRPDAKDAADLTEFAKTLYGRSLSGNAEITVPGNYPYRDLSPAPTAPETSDACIDCKKCAKACPAGAVDIGDVKKIDKAACFLCVRCVNICPVKAKFINPDVEHAVASMLESVAKERRDPEIF